MSNVYRQSPATSAPPHMKGWMARVQIGKVTILFRVSRKVCTIILQNSGIHRFQAGLKSSFLLPFVTWEAYNQMLYSNNNSIHSVLLIYL